MKTKKQVHRKLQVQLLLSQLAALRRELREAIHAYEARLEILLAKIANEFAPMRAAWRLPPERINQIEEMISLLRRRKLKPEKGRRKDLRKIEDLISELRKVVNGDELSQRG